jgi:hypothetical protein
MEGTMAYPARRFAEESFDSNAAPVAADSVSMQAVNNASSLEFAASRAHQAVIRSTWAEKARYLQELFGQRLTAAITGVDDARTVGRWIRGQEPQVAQRERLRDAYQIAKLIEVAESRETAKAWFLGMNPGLDDEPPAQVIAEDLQDGGKRVMKAARSFLAS